MKLTNMKELCHRMFLIFFGYLMPSSSDSTVNAVKLKAKGNLC